MMETINTFHQFIDRSTDQVVTEKLFYDRTIELLYSSVRENAQVLFKSLTSARCSDILGTFNYDTPLKTRRSAIENMKKNLAIDFSECLDEPAALNSARKVFERKIRYWDCRRMAESSETVVSPADSKVLLGSFDVTDRLFIKEKFFVYEELFGNDKIGWLEAFENGDFAIFRLTPDKYHYNHTPVAGKVVDIYEIPGHYHSCNPSAVIHLVSPYSKNKRVVTVIDTDVEGGTQVGLVAMIEIVALMIGDIVQCYSAYRYDSPTTVTPDMFLKKGRPKSLFRPGSSTVVLTFQKDRISFADDIVRNMYRQDAVSRFSRGFGMPLVETDINVRSTIAAARF